MISASFVLIAMASAPASVAPQAVEKCSEYVCLTELGASACFARRANEESCERYIEVLQASPRRSERIFRLAIAACSGELAELATDRARGAELRRQQIATYQSLLAADPGDAIALLEWSGAVEGPAHIDLMRRYVEAAPSDYGVRRLLALSLLNGDRANQLQGIRYLKEAYRMAPAPHRWHVASEVFSSYRALGLDADAATFITEYRKDSGFDTAATRARADAALADAHFVRAAPFRWLETLCDPTTLALLGAEKCFSASGALAKRATELAPQVPSNGIDMIAQTVLDMTLATPTGVPDAVWRESLRKISSTLLGSGYETALLLYAEAMLEKTPDRRLELLRRATAREPSSGEAAGRLAGEYLMQSKYADAIREYERAVTLVPDNKKGPATSALIFALRRAGQTTRADQLQAELEARL